MATALNTLSAQAYPGPIAPFELAGQTSPFGDDVSVESRQGIRRRPTAISPAAQVTANLSERNQLILDHLNLVKAIAVRVRQNLPVNVELDDLVHAGVLGLIAAAKKFNVEKQVSFSSYSKHRIRGAILDSLRESDTASRDLRRRHKDIRAATSALTAELNRTPSDLEVAACLGITVDRLRQTLVLLSSVGDASASTRWTDHDEDLREPEYPSRPETQPDHMCADEQRRDALHRAMVSLPERYRKVVVMYYTNEMTMKDIGAVLGINESRVSQIHKAALEKMNVALQKAGISSSHAL
jgi:RNA polymerase sigma factor FliA